MAYNEHPQTIHIKTDNTGAFSSFISKGSYYICTAYKFPWNQTWHESAYKRIDVKKNKQVKLSIIFNPDWEGLRIDSF